MKKMPFVSYVFLIRVGAQNQSVTFQLSAGQSMVWSEHLNLGQLLDDPVELILWGEAMVL
jgi:hypothetical protein